MAGIGFIKSRLRSVCIRLITFRKLLVLNCAVLLLNVLLYAKNQCVVPVDVHFPIALEPEQRALQDLIFQTFIETMDLNNVTYFVIGGTLVGSWRHHDLIPWDDDIDVMINASDRQEVSRVLRAKVAEDPASFGVFDWAWSEEDYIFQWKFYSQTGESLPNYEYKTPTIDIFFYLENETHIWNVSPNYIDTNIYLKSHVFPLNRRPFGDLMVPAPCNSEAFLEVTYNISECQTRTYDHIFETLLPFPLIKVPCSQLEHLYPFVHRKNTASNGSEEFVVEKLMLRSLPLRRFNARNKC